MSNIFEMKVRIHAWGVRRVSDERIWICWISRNCFATLPSIKCLHPMASWQWPSSRIIGDIRPNSANLIRPRALMYSGTHRASSGCVWPCFSQAWRLVTESRNNWLRPSLGHWLRWRAHSPGRMQLGHLEEAVESIRCSCLPVAQKFVACLESQIWYICGLLLTVVWCQVSLWLTFTMSSGTATLVSLDTFTVCEKHLLSTLGVPWYWNHEYTCRNCIWFGYFGPLGTIVSTMRVYCLVPGSLIVFTIERHFGDQLIYRNVYMYIANLDS